MKPDRPILFNFYAFANGRENFYFGQLVRSGITDFSFKEFSRGRTISTLFDLYRVKKVRNEKIELVFDDSSISTYTDKHGRFQVSDQGHSNKILREVLLSSDDKVHPVDLLYPRKIHSIEAPTIVISDIDDTLLHSFILNKIKMFRTLVFNPVERRKAVLDMMMLLKRLAMEGASIFYLSNSEQNLYPLIYRFLRYNEFPPGPLFLKQLRGFTDVLLNRKLPKGNTHKINSLRRIIETFSGRKFILVGDNTQHDLLIYLQMAEEHKDKIKHIVIRKVHDKPSHEAIVEKAIEELKPYGIGIYYSDQFPSTLRF